MSKHEANGAEAPAIESAEDKALVEILRAQPLSDASRIKLFEIKREIENEIVKDVLANA